LGSDQLLGVWTLVFATAVAGRWLARKIAGRALPFERVLVIGGALETAQVADKLRHNSSVHAAVIGRVALASTEAEVGTIGSINDLEAIVEELGVHRAVVAPGESTYDQTLDGIRAAKAVGVQVSVLPRLLEVVGSSVEFDQLNGVTVLGVRRFGLTSSSAAVKRAMDLFGAAAGLLFLAPLFTVFAVLVKLSSPGPVFFRQRRIGQDGRPFELIKFRTMVRDAEQRRRDLLERNEAAEGLFKIADDPRVTPIGRFLRRSSLDELPQLINVLRGEMSLVGPRPLVPEEDSRIEGRHRRRLHLKPGMTGHWQIFGSSRIPIREMVTIDYLYVANWSLWGDIKILCRTVPHVLGRRGL
jgi:exopolysaccharide biosynthesis polyprenyl glycosylphosphotransferase